MNLSDPELERSYLGLCLDMPEALDAGLTVEHLAVPDHRALMACMLGARQASQPIDDVAMVHALERRGLSRAQATQILLGVRSAPMRGVGSIAPTLRSLHDARTLHEAAALGASLALGGDTTKAREVLAKAAFSAPSVTEIYTMREAMEAAAVVFDEAARARRDQLGSSRFVSLGLCETVDRLLTVGPGDTVIIAAETNIGKSSISMTCMLSLEQRRIPAGLISVEDPKEDWGAKAIGHYAQVDTSDFWAGTPTQQQWNLAMSGVGAVAAREQVTRFATCKSGSLEEVVQAMATMVRVHRARVLFIDYIQAISCAAMERAQPKQQIDHVYRVLQATGRQLDVPIVIGSQFSRGTSDESFKEPSVKRLKESGNLENGAQAILLFWATKEDSQTWQTIRGKVGKLKRAPRRPKWAMRRGHGGTLTEVEWTDPPVSPSPTRKARF